MLFFFEGWGGGHGVCVLGSKALVLWEGQSCICFLEVYYLEGEAYMNHTFWEFIVHRYHFL